MQSSDRFHALDAVRALALLLGIALHEAQPYLHGMFWVTTQTPSDTLAGVWYTIHLFRMPLFFLIAGFFGRMMLERRGMSGFIKDRSRRILLPLVAGLPIIMAITGVVVVLGALAVGGDTHALQPPPSAHHGVLASINLIHLWFLYYLALFYAAALIARIAFHSSLDRGGRVQATLDTAVGFLTTRAWGPLILAVPSILYYCHLQGWSSWAGLPAPFSLIPDPGALVGYGVFFGFGWLLHRQQSLLFSLQKRWALYGVLAILTWAVCRAVGGTSPHWGPYLKDGALLVYTASYMVGAWVWSFALIGIAMRFLSSYSPVRRYLADASYWIYLMHIPALFFFDELLHPLHLHWSLQYPLCMACAMAVLLLSYHYLVRFSFIGATLNGRRQPRAATAPLRMAAEPVGK